MSRPEMAAAAGNPVRGTTMEEDLDLLDRLLREGRAAEAAVLTKAIDRKLHRPQAGRSPDPETERIYAGGTGDPERVSFLLRRTEQVLERCAINQRTLLLELGQARAQGRFGGPGIHAPPGIWLSEQA